MTAAAAVAITFGQDQLRIVKVYVLSPLVAKPNPLLSETT
eukprot:CAMPEP_0201218148 /NCGR_PEP_ID=MMETSP0851-20130426/190429_1 /ASSEMBLY_ACC=CAM_ASM_000631 /TAXON_ID=183588 /ORGANISM="Pseudo-nitzschia fraudulenta, Strain WWA7" /LENGTH=39 /DNA_ID= /DNA_START= /DNA_END= /DNA_ORIENTATION=